KITFSLEELLKILISNELLPRQIIRARVKGQRVHFVIRTNAFILPFIPASLRYISFDNNNAIFELTIASGHLNKAVSRLNQALKLKIPACMKLEYPNISVDIDRLLEEKNIKGVQVKDVLFENGDFTIVTGKI
ncbi:unnamed protein product, partial [marine sediment metagenome]